MANGIVTLCTDFGLRDGYVAAMKGAMLAVAPGLTLVDISHEVAPQAIAEGAFVLSTAYDAFPAGTVHLAVVDPGVGSARRALAVRTPRHTLVAPDNGVLTHVLRREGVVAAVALAEPAYWRRPVSATFHGRDVFAPVAAHLALGVPLEALGPPAEDLVTLDWPAPERRGALLLGHVAHVDRFGNVISDVPAALLGDARVAEVEVGALRVGGAGGLLRTYAEAPRGGALALIGSHGHLEVAVREASAAAASGARIGDEVRVRLA